MNDDYLWDRSGPPDLEVARLEQRAGAAALPPSQRRAPLHGRWAMAGALLAAAAGLLLMVTPGAADHCMAGGRSETAAGADRAHRQYAGTPGSRRGRPRGPAPPTRYCAPRGGKRLALQRGELHAFIWAPARDFVVETPSARAVDLGCEYTLNVDEKGDGVLRVSLGWVAFQVGDREAFIPAGATCATRKRGGPGIPYFEDTSDELRRGVERFERGDRGALGGLLAAAGPHDGLTLWHLLTRVPEADRGAVFDRFRELVQLPAGVSRDSVLHRDPRAIDQCWNALDLQNTGWWRGWERKWSE